MAAAAALQTRAGGAADLGQHVQGQAAGAVLQGPQLKPEAELLFVTAQAAEFVPPSDLLPITIGVVDKAQAWDQLVQLLQNWWMQRLDKPLEMLCSAQKFEAIERLTPREKRLLRELGGGLLNKEIAARLQLSVATVESYRKSVAAKLGVSGAEMVHLATLYRTFSWQVSEPTED